MGVGVISGTLGVAIGMGVNGSGISAGVSTGVGSIESGLGEVNEQAASKLTIDAPASLVGIPTTSDLRLILD